MTMTKVPLPFVSKFSIGDVVSYSDMLFTVEKDYGNGVYRIGNDIAFVDCVSERMLIGKDEGNV